MKILFTIFAFIFLQFIQKFQAFEFDLTNERKNFVFDVTNKFSPIKNSRFFDNEVV